VHAEMDVEATCYTERECNGRRVHEGLVGWSSHGGVKGRVVGVIEHATGDAALGLIVDEHPLAIAPLRA